MFYMNMRAYNEGEQAEAYKKRKAEERFQRYKDDKPRSMTAYSDDGRHKDYVANQYRGFSAYDSNEKRFKTKAEENGLSRKEAEAHGRRMTDISRKAGEITRREYNRRNSEDFDYDYPAVHDATNRHVRRHPEQYAEGSLFESVEFI